MKQFTVEAMFGIATKVKTYEAASRVEAIRQASEDGALAVKKVIAG